MMDSLTPALKARLDTLVQEHPVLIFMKGDLNFPACGFSARAVQALKLAGFHPIHSVNVLEDQEIREGVKLYSNWPTIPQVYIRGQFIGGSDILLEMLQAGELQKLAQA